MEKDRDQLTPDDPDDREFLQQHRGQGTAGTGLDRLEDEEPPGYVATGEDEDEEAPASGLEE